MSDPDAPDPRARLDLDAVAPTQVPDRLRLMSQFAAERAGDPVTALDDLNPMAPREWLVIGLVCNIMARDMERRLEGVLAGAGSCPGPGRSAECSNFACRRHGCQGG